MVSNSFAPVVKVTLAPALPRAPMLASSAGGVEDNEIVVGHSSNAAAQCC